MHSSAPYSHPQANCHMLFNGQRVDFLLRHSPRRRSVGLQVGAQGLVVTAPGHLSAPQLEALLRTRADWIVRKLHERAQQPAPVVMAWGPGMTLSYQGQTLRVQCPGWWAGAGADGPVQPVPVPAAAVAAYSARLLQKSLGGISHMGFIDGEDGGILSVSHPPDAVMAHVRTGLPARAAWLCALVRCWMQQQMRRTATHRLHHYGELLGVRHRAWEISSARTRWGSANSRGSIRLHWRLIQLPAPILDYVVVHELCHLREMNHGPRFWALVQSVCPDWQQLRQQLHQTRLPAWLDGPGSGMGIGAG